MKKNLFLILVSFLTLSVSAAERVTFDQLRSNWSKYINKDVVVTTPLVVCGSYFDSLVLAPERLYCAEEKAIGLADGDSTLYWAIKQQNKERSIVVNCRNKYYNVRTGDRVRTLKARVSKERHLVTGSGVKTCHSKEDKLPKPEKGILRVVGANIENYFADLGGYAHKRTTPDQQALQTKKLVKGLKAMNADIFAFCEMQIGDKAPKMLLEELNKGKVQYDFVSMPLANMDRIGGCFVYRVDKVKPYGQPKSAYKDTASHYHGRMFAVGFEQIETGEKIIISINHFKSKRIGRDGTNGNDKRMNNADSLIAMLPKAIVEFNDADVLLLGDYNCYTQEQPIQTIVRNGYGDQLWRFCNDDYSYVYKGEMGFLDRCFASPSMAEQITNVRTWHVNADWYYQHGAHKMKDKSYHRYSDHDPIIVDIKTSSR